MFKLIDGKKLTGYASIDKPHEIGESFLSKHPIIPNISVYSAFKLLSSFYLNDKAIDCLCSSINYRKLLDDSLTVSLALQELGVKKGQIVSISMPNFYQGVVSFFACNRIGATATFLNPNAGLEEIRQYLNLFESEVFINYNKTDDENKNLITDTNVRYVITLNKKDVNNLHFDRTTIYTKAIDFNALGSIAKYQKKYPIIGSNKDSALIAFTSGSTGNPKCVELTGLNLLSCGIYLKNSSHVSRKEDPKVLAFVPFSYPYGFVTSTLLTLLSGKEVILTPNFSLETLNYYLKKQPNIIFGSPALLETIKKNTQEGLDLSSITTFISGGDFLTPKQIISAQDFFKEHNANVTMCNGSGNAETCGSGTNPVGQKIRIDTTGKPLIGTDCMIVDSEMLEKGIIIELPYNKEGTLLVSGKNVCKGYYKNPKLTQQSRFEYNGKEWFNTGTRGYIDEDGYFTLTGRASRFYINISGEKVYMDRIQNFINLFDFVDACAVVKVEDDTNLYVNKVYIVLKSKFENKEAIEELKKDSIKYSEHRNEMLEIIKEKVSQAIYDPNIGTKVQLKSFEIPTYYEIVDSLPRKDYSEKIDYQALEEDALAKLNKGRQKVKK